MPPKSSTESAPADQEAIEEGAIEAEPVLVDGLIDGDTPIPMAHPDGGACDAYKTKGKNLMVPACDVPVMLAHGFIVTAGTEA